MLNKIIVMGRLTRDPELRRTQSGLAVTSFSVACDRDFKNQAGEKETDFIDVVAWRSTAEFVSKYFTKGRMAVVEGRLQIRDWTDNNGGKRRSAEIVADNVYFGDSKRDGDGGGYQQGGYQQQGGYAPQSYGGAPAGGYQQVPSGYPLLTTAALKKSVKRTESCRSEQVARETGRRPTKGGDTLWRAIGISAWNSGRTARLSMTLLPKIGTSTSTA